MKKKGVNPFPPQPGGMDSGGVPMGPKPKPPKFGGAKKGKKAPKKSGLPY